MKTFLFVLVVFIAVSSAISGLLMIINPDGELLNLPLSLLEGTPFKNYLIPGILLLGIVGTVNIGAVYASISQSTMRYNWSLAGGIMITGWITIQMILIQSIHWLHFFYLSAGLLIILISYQLKGRWAA